MKQPKRLKRDFKAVARAYNQNSDNWALVEEKEFFIKVIRKDTIGTAHPVYKLWDKFRR